MAIVAMWRDALDWRADHSRQWSVRHVVQEGPSPLQRFILDWNILAPGVKLFILDWDILGDPGLVHFPLDWDILDPPPRFLLSWDIVDADFLDAANAPEQRPTHSMVKTP